MRKSGLLLAFTTVLSLSAGATAQPAAPAEPTPPTPPTPPVSPAVPVAPVAPPSAAAPATAASPRSVAPLQNAVEARRGVVRLERAGRRIGFGAVLRSDGRILSALSALGHGNFIQARFADDSVLAVKVVASDRAWDLALLAPEGGHWTEGLRASTLDAPESSGSLHRFRARGARLEEGAIGTAARAAVLGRDGAMLDDALVLSPRVEDDELGSPLFDDRGDVAAIVVQACAPSNTQSCQLVGYGAPVSALRQFLKRAPRREPLPAAYVGLRGIAAHEGAVAGVRVVAVDADSPAERAGLHGDAPARGAGDAASGDIIVAVEDAPVATPDELRDAINRFAFQGASGAATPASGAGAAELSARLLVFGSGKFREVKLPVRAPRQLPAPSPAPPPGSSGGEPPAPAPADGNTTGADAPAQSAPATAPTAPSSAG